MIVVDASALTDVLLPTAAGRELDSLVRNVAGGLHAPSLIDAEVASSLRAFERWRGVTTAHVDSTLTDLVGFPLVRHDCRPLLARAWELRANFTIYDALYVALAEAAGGAFLTTDRRLGRAVRRHTAVVLATA